MKTIFDDGRHFRDYFSDLDIFEQKKIENRWKSEVESITKKVFGENYGEETEQAYNAGMMALYFTKNKVKNVNTTFIDGVHNYFLREHVRAPKKEPEIYFHVENVLTPSGKDLTQILRSGSKKEQNPEKPYNQEKVIEALKLMDDDVRDALLLRYVQGLPREEVRKVIGGTFHHLDYLIKQGRRIVKGVVYLKGKVPKAKSKIK